MQVGQAKIGEALRRYSVEHLLAFAVCSSPAFLMLGLILHFGVDLPVMDQWSPDIAGLFTKAHDGTLGLSDLLVQHNEHRIVIPRAIILALGLATHWNTMAELLLQWLIVCATSVGILKLCLYTEHWRAEPDKGRRRQVSLETWFTWFLCNLLIFTPAQWENALWGLGMENVLPMAFIVWALVTVVSSLPERRKTALAILLSSAATFSSGNGLLAWPLVGALLLWSDSWVGLKHRKSATVAWALAFGINCALYFMGYARSEPPAEQFQQITGTKLIHYNLIFLGNSFQFCDFGFPVASVTLYGAAALLVLLLVVAYFYHAWRWRRDVRLCHRLLVWLAVAGFAVLSGLMASIFRAGYGADQAASSRYVTFALYLPVALINLVPLICSDLRRTRDLPAGISWACPRVLPLAGAALIALEIYALPSELDFCQITWRNHLQGKAALLLVNVLPESPLLSLASLSDYPQLRRHANALSEIGYFRPPLVAVTNASQLFKQSAAFPRRSCGRLEEFSQDDRGQITIFGHATRPGTSKPADGVFLTYDNESGEPIIFLGARLGAQRIVNGSLRPVDWSLWAVTFDPARLPKSQRQITIRGWELDTRTGTAWPLDDPITLNIAISK